MKTIMRSIVYTLLFAALFLSSCDNPVNVVDKLVTDVKVANNMFLKVSDFAPTDNKTNVPPDADITIQFDRAIDPATATAQTVVITPNLDDNGAALVWSFSYNADNYTLTVKHSNFLKMTQAFTVRVTKGVKAAKGGELQDERVWSFTTGAIPVGTVTINNGSAYVTNNNDVTLKLTYNSLVDRMRFCTDVTEIDNDTAPWVMATSPYTFTLATGEGEKTVYAQFRHDFPDSTHSVSSVVNDTIIRDTVPPTVDAGTISGGYLSASAPSKAPGATASDATSGIATYSWVKTSGTGTVTFSSSAAVLDPTVSADADGPYTLTLTVTDNAGLSAIDTVGFTRDVTAPIVDAGSAGGYLTTGTTSLTLSATASDGTSGSGIASYSWAKTAGTGTVNFSSTSVLSPTVSADVDGVYTLTLTVTDNAGNTATDTVNITRDTIAPVVDAGTISGYLTAGTPSKSPGATASDATSGIDTYSWAKTSGPGTVTFLSASVLNPTISADADGAYTVALTVTDKAGNTSSDTVTFSRDATLPVIDAGADPGYLSTGTPSRALSATASDGAGGSGIASYSWAKTSGAGTVTFTPSASILSPTVSADADGSYTLTLTVTDNAGNAATDTVGIKRDTTPPAVDAGANPGWLTSGTPSRSLAATVTDATSGVGSYAWAMTSGPGTVTFSNAAVEDPSVSASAEGSYVLTLTATDNAGNSASDTVAVGRDTIAPTVDAGTISLWLNKATPGRAPGATASDATSGIATYAWAKTSGPGTVSFSTSSGILNPTVSASADGAYVITLTVTDVAGNSASDTVSFNRDVTAPAVEAGAGGYISIKYTTLALSGSATDTGSGISSYYWKGKGTGTITYTPSNLVLNPTVSASADDSYEIHLIATDVAGNSNDDYVVVVRDTVVPTADAGTLPAYLNIAAPSATTNSTASDAGSGIASYAWVLSSGPTGGVVTYSTSSTILNPTVSADLDGTYTLKLTVMDKAGNGRSDTVSFTNDLTAPTPPTVTGTASPATTLTPTWNWTHVNGNGTFQYRLDGGTFVQTTALTFKPASNLLIGPHTVYVQETEASGNWSAMGYFVVYITPKDIFPLWGATGVTRTPKVQWPVIKEATTYRLYTRVPKGAWGYIIVETNSYTVTTALAANTRYDWYVVGYSGSTALGQLPNYPSQASASYYTFTTVP
jgi:hypothetical protein